MSLRNDYRKSKIVQDIAGVDDRVSLVEVTIGTIFSDLIKLQNFINSKPYFSTAEKAEIQTIIDESYKVLWDQSVARTPVVIKDTNRN